MIFLTIGTLSGFDRLVQTVDEAVAGGSVRDEVFAQIGPGRYRPRFIEFTNMLDKNDFEKWMRSSEALISHAGIGSITTALRHNKPLLVMPRLRRYGEHVNDHQLYTARKFEALGHLMAAYNESELIMKIPLIRQFTPSRRAPNRDGIIQKIQDFINSAQYRES